eukprot:710241-Amphidinium_carterae.1
MITQTIQELSRQTLVDKALLLGCLGGSGRSKRQFLQAFATLATRVAEFLGWVCKRSKGWCAMIRPFNITSSGSIQ